MSRVLTGVGLGGIVALKIALVGVMFALTGRLSRRGFGYAVIAAIGLLGAAGNLTAI